MKSIICQNCKKLFKVYPSRLKRQRVRFCSKECMGLSWKGKNNPNWKGGILLSDKGKGYKLIFSPKHPLTNKMGYVQEHRLIMEKSLGRYLEKNELVHHKNGKKQDNRIENLQIITHSQHSALHSKGRYNGNWKGGMAKKHCIFCNKEYEVKPGRKDSAMFCGLMCWSKYWREKRKERAMSYG